MLQSRSLLARTCVRWHRFSYKSYSAFCSLGRIVAICAISVSTLSAATAANGYDARYRLGRPAAAEADSDEPDPVGADSIALEELEVTASTVSVQPIAAARTVAVITEAEIEELPSLSVADILKFVSAVDVRQRGPMGVQVDISVDGGTFDQVTILLNGINISSPQIGHYSADWPVDPSDIDRIEVLEGASSRVNGGSSLMGVINIITKEQSGSPLTATVEGGSFGTFGASARLGYDKGAFRNHISGSFRRSDGGTVNSALRRGQVYYQGAYITDKVEARLQAGFSDMDHGANTFYSALYPDQHDHLRRWLASASVLINTPVKLEAAGYFTRTFDHYQLTFGSPKGENYHRADVYGAHLNATYKWVGGTTLIGADFRHESIVSTNIGAPRTPVHCTADIDYIYGDARTGVNLKLNHTVRFGHFMASAGVVAAYNNGYDRRFHFYPGVDASYTIDSSWRVFAMWNTGFRMPTFTDLYYKSATHQGNPDLKPERMQSVQGGVSFTRSFVSAKAYAFYHRGTDMLDWVMYSPDDVYHSASFSLDNIGACLQASLNFSPLLGEKQPLKTLSAGYTYITQHRRDAQEVFKSNYALEYLRNKLVLTLSHRIYKGLVAAWSYRWQDRCGQYLDYSSGTQSPSLIPYKPYSILDLKLMYELPHWELYVEATNLTNTRYHDFGNIPQPGIWVMAGVTYTL